MIGVHLIKNIIFQDFGGAVYSTLYQDKNILYSCGSKPA